MRDMLVERPFGQYMDKTFRDVNSGGDLFEYLRGPLADAWFNVDAVRCRAAVVGARSAPADPQGPHAACVPLRVWSAAHAERICGDQQQVGRRHTSAADPYCE